MAEMMRLRSAVPTIALDGAPGLRLASDGSLPGGSYRFVSRSVTQGGCTRTVQMARAAGDAEPNVVTRKSGDCDGAAEVAPAPRSEERRVGEEGGRTGRSGWSPYR